MKEIKRFHEAGYGTSEMKLSGYGDWVLYDDHAEMVAALQEQLSNYSMSAGQADQRKSESDTVRVALGFSADADDVAPCDLVDAIAALQEQVRALAAEANYLRNEIKQHSNSVHFCEVCGKDDPCKTDDVCCSLNHPLPATDTVIREIRAQAVEEYAATVGAVKNGARYAASIRSGEQS